MPGPATQANNIARSRLYLGSAKQGTVFNRDFNFYSGSPTTPNSYTGNLVLGTQSNGPGANIINGIGPVLEEPLSCDDPTITNVVVVAGPSDLTITVTYENPLPSDIYQIFSNTGGSYTPVSVTVIGLDTVELVFGDPALFVAGVYNLKIMRASDPSECFDIEYNVYTAAGVPCIVVAEAWTLPGNTPFPGFFFPSPVPTEIHGSGFTSCTIDVVVELVFGAGPPTLPVVGLTVINDNLITFTVDGTTAIPFSNFSARVVCTDIPGCEDLADNGIIFGVA